MISCRAEISLLEESRRDSASNPLWLKFPDTRGLIELLNLWVKFEFLRFFVDLRLFEDGKRLISTVLFVILLLESSLRFLQAPRWVDGGWGSFSSEDSDFGFCGVLNFALWF